MSNARSSGRSPQSDPLSCQQPRPISETLKWVSPRGRCRMAGMIPPCRRPDDGANAGVDWLAALGRVRNADHRPRTPGGGPRTMNIGGMVRGADPTDSYEPDEPRPGVAVRR